MEQYVAWACLLAGYFLSRFAELRVHSRNYQFVKFAGGEELIPHQMRRFYLVTIVVPLVAVLEGAFGSALLPTPIKIASLFVLGSSLILRFAAISSLGRLWTMRCICVPGLPICKKGPYRFLRHPEYASRWLDAVALALLFDAPVTAGIFSIYFALALSRIVAIENRQLGDLGFDLAAELDGARE